MIHHLQHLYMHYLLQILIFSQSPTYCMPEGLYEQVEDDGVWLSLYTDAVPRGCLGMC